MVGNSVAKSLDRLEHHFDGCGDGLWTQHLNDFLVDFLNGEGLVDVANVVLHLFLRFAEFLKTMMIGGIDETVHATFLQQVDSCTEGTELFQAGHVDAIIVGIAYLRSTAHHHNLLGMQAIEDAEDALLERGATNNAIVDNNQIVYTWLETLVGDVVDV